MAPTKFSLPHQSVSSPMRMERKDELKIIINDPRSILESHYGGVVNLDNKDGVDTINRMVIILKKAINTAELEGGFHLNAI